MQALPHAALAPLRYVRVRVQTDAQDGGTLELVGPSGLETSSLIQAGPRTTWVEWKDLEMEPGEYAVWFRGSCTARDRIIVSGGED